MKKQKENSDFIFQDEFKPRSRPSSGRRSQQTTPDLTDDKAKKELEDLFDLNMKTRRPTSGRRKLLSPPDPDEVKKPVRYVRVFFWFF